DRRADFFDAVRGPGFDRPAADRRPGLIPGRAVAVAAADPERAARPQDAWTRHPAGVDGIAEREIGELVRADVADGGESRFEGLLRVSGAEQRTLRRRLHQILMLP